MIRTMNSCSLFNLATKRSNYILGIYKNRWLSHYYWGARIEPDALAMECIPAAPAAYEVAGDEADKSFSLNRVPFEYPYGLSGDFRSPAFEAYSEGRAVLDLRVESWRVFPGRPELPGLPHIRVNESANVETLEFTLADSLTGFTVLLSYTVFEESDIIARNATIRNSGSAPLDILSAYSFSLDLQLPGAGAEREELELLSLQGAWARERSIIRQPIRAGRVEIGSVRGISGHFTSPNCALLRRGTGEDSGEAWAFSLVYSGDWSIACERNEEGSYRVQGGLNPSTFAWSLEPGGSFACPEALLCYSSEGLSGMSRNFHDAVIGNILPSGWARRPRPILINNWEATYFDFDEDRLISIAEAAKGLGVELFVMDDGWFGKRDDDASSLGDWSADPRKLPGGLPALAERIRALGLKFGLWIEPEMISPDSELYRTHPDWCLHMEGRPRSESRNQLVLDLTRAEVREWIAARVRGLLASCRPDYVKWDMNRPFSHAGSCALPADAGARRLYQKEIRHRCALGLYEVMGSVTSAFPEILFEGCAGGGGRMDMGMLCYMPQYWTSDNTDALDRAAIQYGTSLFMPPLVMGSHVSAVPNHQTGRRAPLKARSLVAMSGNLGYELDPSSLSDEEREGIKASNDWYKAHRSLLQFGRFWRLASPFEGNEASWIFVSRDGREALVFWLRALSRANRGRESLLLRGLNEGFAYTVTAEGRPQRTLSGSELMRRGLPLSPARGDGEALLFELSAKEGR
jgi:alpha-galactosidase